MDFQADNDQLADKNGEFTSARLIGGRLPDSFSICMAYMVEAWHTEQSAADLFSLQDDQDVYWGNVYVVASPTYMQYILELGPIFTAKKIPAVFFPLQWTRVCLSVDSVGGNVLMVVDGQLLVEEEYKREEDNKFPTNVSILTGFFSDNGKTAEKEEYTGRTTNLNVFGSNLSEEQMVRMTTPGNAECGALGDLVNWEEAAWTLISQARIVEVDREWEGPCRREPKVQVYIADFKWHHDCMRHCEKIAGGRSPPVSTQQEWENLTVEVDLITYDSSNLSNMYYILISATEGDRDLELARLEHWPETEIVNNVTQKLEAEETIWRDFYTGERLGDWQKPWYDMNNTDTAYGESSNCMRVYTGANVWKNSWFEFTCTSYDQSCPCSYPVQPILRLRGACRSSSIDSLFSPKQLPDNPGNMLMIGRATTRIAYNESASVWMLTDVSAPVTATSKASKTSFVLGRHTWTISNDDYMCNEGREYTTMLKMTGCNPDGEFTCDDGQCIKMERRCDQVTGKVPNCRDESDEEGCQLIVFKNNYNKNIPPIGNTKDGRAIPAFVSISITLMKVVEIEEVDHSIHLQFQISLSWKENRVTYQNLKTQTSLNALTADDINTIWLPLIVYDNTDQKELTRLGEYGNGEWSTDVTVTREGNFTRSDIREIHEAEIFQGTENRLTMNQTYTWEFQCKYKLQQYPFDTQVIQNLHLLMAPPRNVRSR